MVAIGMFSGQMIFCILTSSFNKAYTADTTHLIYLFIHIEHIRCCYFGVFHSQVACKKQQSVVVDCIYKLRAEDLGLFGPVLCTWSVFLCPFLLNFSQPAEQEIHLMHYIILLESLILLIKQFPH